MPAKKKPDAIRRNTPHLVDMRAHKRLVPEPPEALDTAAAVWWETYADSDLAAGYRPHMFPVLLRLARLWGEIESLERAKLEVVNAGETFVEGSAGQWKTHPVYDELRKLRGEALGLEREFGFTPKAVESLGLAVAQKSKAIEDVNRAIRNARGDEAPVVVPI